MLPIRCGGLMVSALDSGSGGPGSSPGWGTVLQTLPYLYLNVVTPLLPGVHNYTVLEQKSQ